MNKKHCFTIDLEDWFQGNEIIKMKDFHRYESRIHYSTNYLLDLFDEFNIKSTFFVLGYVGEQYPDIIKRISSKGHEIASHGYSHELVYLQSKNEFEEETKKSKQICEDATGYEVKGYRASNWTITERSMWALDILLKLGFKYDSSIYPYKTYLFGIDGAPRFPYQHANGLLEIPPSTTNICGKTLPFSGGFFLRAWPKFVMQYFINRIEKADERSILYLHPWEIDNEQPRNLPIPIKNQIIHYYKLKSTRKKLRYIFKRNDFGRIDHTFNI